MVWPGMQGNVFGIVNGLAWRARHGIWYGLAGHEWCLVWPDGHGMIYCVAWRTSHGMWYGLARNVMVYEKA